MARDWVAWHWLCGIGDSDGFVLACGQLDSV